MRSSSGSWLGWLGLLLGLLIPGTLPAQGLPNPGEGIAVSLREMTPEVQKSTDARKLFGATQLDGFLFTEDSRGKDCILLLRQEKDRPGLRLSDLAVAWKNMQDGKKRPACTIDPREVPLMRLGQISEQFGARNAPMERLIEDWKKYATEPQMVKVFNVETDSPFGRTMVEADYLLKSVCDGTETIPGVTGFHDLVLRQARDQIVRTGQLQGPSNSMNRFWFNPGKQVYQSSGKLHLLTACQVALLTEAEAVDGFGQRAGKGGANPLAREFTEQFTAKYDAVARAKPIYRELENLYRAVATTALLQREAKAAGLVEMIDASLGKADVVKRLAMPTVPGRSTVRKLEVPVAGGVVVVWLPSCGGVSIDIQAERMKKEEAAPELPQRVQTIESKRPNAKATHWRF